MRGTLLKTLSMLVLLNLGIAQTAKAGSIDRLFYTNFTGTTIFELTIDPAFPDSPGGSEVLTNLFEGTESWGDQFGSYVRGYIQAPQTGDYTFWIASDDDSELWLSTDATAANKVLIASVTGYTGSREWEKYPDTQVSFPVPLVRGNQYYVEALQRDGTGGDNLAVAWQVPGSTNREVIPALHLMPYRPPGTPVAITQQPASVSVNEGYPATFTVNVEAGTPPTLQWYKNDAAIPNAILSYYATDRATMADNGARYHVKINGSLDSATATLTVIDDATPPRVVLASTRLGTSVLIEYDEVVDPASATATGNYAIAGITFTGASMVDTRTVSLAIVGSLPANFEVTLGGIRDYAGNAIPAGTVVPGYTTGLAPNMVSYWPLDRIEGTRTPDIISGYDLNLENMAAEHLVDGKFGKCFLFDNERKALLKRVHNPGDNLPIYNHVAFTVSVWVNGPIQTDHRVYCESRSTANQPMFSIGTHQTGVSSGLGSVDTYIRNDANTTSGDHHFHGIAFDDTWHHICYVQNSNATPRAVLYIDGVRDDVLPAPMWPMTINTTAIGAIVRASAAAWFTGMIDDVAVWSRALEPEEVTFLFTRGTPTPPPTVLPLTISSFESELAAVAKGDPVTIRWDVSKDAGSVEIQPDIGDVTAITSVGVGSTTVTLNTSKTYTLTIRRGNDTPVSAQLKVAAIDGVAAGWTLLDNFDRYAVGALPRPWGITGPGVTVADVSGNRMLSVAAAEAMAGLSLNNLTVMEGQQRTLFARFYFTQTPGAGTVNQYMGLSDKGIRFYGDSDGELGPDVGFQNALGPVEIGTWNGFGAAFEAGAFELQPQTAYNLWIDVRNDSIAEGDLVSIHIARDGDAGRTTLFQDYRSDRNPTPDPGDLIGYPTKPDLRTLTVAGNTTGSLVYFDDFYLSKSAYLATVPRVYGFSTAIEDLVVQPPTLTAATVEAGNFRFGMPTQTGVSYVVEGRASLSAGTWETVQTVPGTGQPVSVSIPVAGGIQFYRVRAQ